MAFNKAVLLFAALFVATVAAQSASAPSSSTGSLPAGVSEIQAQLRSEVDPTSFVTSFSAPGQRAATVNSAFGSVSFLLKQNSPALSTLPNGGLGQGIITLQACGLWSPHTHPRANEILYVATGNLSIGFKEENPTNTSTGQVGGRLLNFTVPAGSSIVIPQGLLHYAYNPSCSAASIVTSFDNSDPGTVSAVQELFDLPTNVVAAATGLPAASISLVANSVAQVAIIAVDRTCLQSCPGAPGSSVPAAASMAPSTG